MVVQACHGQSMKISAAMSLFQPLDDRLNRARGALLGLAVGDAIGTTVEFRPRGSFEPLTDMVGGGPFNLVAGQWTDDCSMMLCLATSLVEKGFNTHDQMRRYLLWREDGHMSSTGKCFDIGGATSAALDRFQSTGNPIAGSALPDSAGNGSLMRLAPVPIFFQYDPVLAIEMCVAQSKTTHQAPECLDACRLLGTVLLRAFQGLPKVEVLADIPTIESMSESLMLIAAGDYKNKTESVIVGSGYVVRSLEAALWCFWSTNSFRECVLNATNLGDDADTTAAIAGQIAGAFYGESGIPAPWLQKLHMAKEIGILAEKLAFAGSHRPNVD